MTIDPTAKQIRLHKRNAQMSSLADLEGAFYCLERNESFLAIFKCNKETYAYSFFTTLN